MVIECNDSIYKIVLTGKFLTKDNCYEKNKCALIGWFCNYFF